eukprot:scaffold220_cov169-Amphora_coffeaeformis.AAC.24
MNQHDTVDHGVRHNFVCFLSFNPTREQRSTITSHPTIIGAVHHSQTQEEDTNRQKMSQPILPCPLDSPTLENPLECPPLRWGLIGCGRVSHDFTQALKHIPTARVVACSTASDATRAQAFANKHGIEQAYGTYEELVNDPNVDIVYVGNVHAFRLQIGGECVVVEERMKCYEYGIRNTEYSTSLVE